MVVFLHDSCGCDILISDDHRPVLLGHGVYHYNSMWLLACQGEYYNGLEDVQNRCTAAGCTAVSRYSVLYRAASAGVYALAAIPHNK